jgi:2,3-bisphosphoglycerate-independent phosphoglycerate mutase
MGTTKTIRGSEWVESSLMTKNIKIITQMGEDDVVYLHLKEVHDASGDLLIRSFKLLPDGTIEPLN